ncbi:MAG: LPS export ABC transporter periplasmic protein LptC [Elusimicrobia bacterium]|nr:LPS export ABC transporter periplasmic protein LptC [Elusimicrobiota bacterium]
MPALALALASCAREGPPAPLEASQTMQEFAMTQTAKGVRIWALDAPVARVSLEGAAVLDHPEIRFYRDGRHASTARSLTATVRGDGKDVALVGQVVITSLSDKTVLRTERLDYSAETERFRTEEAVVVERPDAVLHGRGLEADATLDNITIYHQETRIKAAEAPKR